MQLNEHVSPVTPLQVVGEFEIVSPLLQLFATQLPPENAPFDAQTCEPVTECRQRERSRRARKRKHGRSDPSLWFR